MPGTLVITTLSDGTNSTSATNPIQGSAKAWVNFNGSTAGIRASYNVSSITRAGTGRYTVNFTNALTDANYCPTLAIQSRASSNDYLNYIFNDLPAGAVTTTTPTTTSYTILTNQYDPAYVCTGVFR